MKLLNKKRFTLLFIFCFSLKVKATIPVSLKIDTTDDYNIIEKTATLSYGLKLQIQNFSIFALYKKSSIDFFKEIPTLVPTNYGGQYNFSFDKKNNNFVIILGGLTTSGIMSLAKNPVPACYTSFSRQVSSISTSLFSLNTTSINPDDKNIAILWENKNSFIDFGLGTAFDFNQNNICISGAFKTNQKKIEKPLSFKNLSLSFFAGIHLNPPNISEKEKILYPQFPKEKETFFAVNFFSETNKLKLKGTLFFEPHYKYENCYSTRFEAEFKPFFSLKFLQTFFYSSFSSRNWQEEFISTRFLSNTGLVFSPNFINSGIFIALKKPSATSRWQEEPFNLKISLKNQFFLQNSSTFLVSTIFPETKLYKPNDYFKNINILEHTLSYSIPFKIKENYLLTEYEVFINHSLGTEIAKKGFYIKNLLGITTFDIEINKNFLAYVSLQGGFNRYIVKEKPFLLPQFSSNTKVKFKKKLKKTNINGEFFTTLGSKKTKTILKEQWSYTSEIGMKISFDIKNF